MLPCVRKLFHELAQGLDSKKYVRSSIRQKLEFANVGSVQSRVW